MDFGLQVPSMLELLLGVGPPAVDSLDSLSLIKAPHGQFMSLLRPVPGNDLGAHLLEEGMGGVDDPKPILQGIELLVRKRTSAALIIARSGGFQLLDDSLFFCQETPPFEIT